MREERDVSGRNRIVILSRLRLFLPSPSLPVCTATCTGPAPLLLLLFLFSSRFMPKVPPHTTNPPFHAPLLSPMSAPFFHTLPSSLFHTDLRALPFVVLPLHLVHPHNRRGCGCSSSSLSPVSSSRGREKGGTVHDDRRYVCATLYVLVLVQLPIVCLGLWERGGREGEGE